MKNKLILAFLIAAGFASSGNCQLKNKPVLDIQVNQRGAKISPHLYGLFFENINNALEGGLYAELIRNRDFEDSRKPEGMWFENGFIRNAKGWKEKADQVPPLDAWNLIKSGNCDGTIALDSIQPLSVKNPYNLRFEVNRIGSGRIAFANTGFWGINIKDKSKYNFSFYVRPGAYKGGLIISLEHISGKKLARTVISDLKPGWNRYQAELTANGNDANARLVIETTGKGTLWVDLVSLFPADTYKGRPNGMRKDLAVMLQDAKPGFLRFPGGCVVEGGSLANRIKWKETIGDLKDRPGRWNVWNYHTNEGIGYHEYLQFCEDLGTTGLWVFNCGMSCQARNGEVIPDSEIESYIQEALDGIEYAIGPATSKWGSLRAKNGHPTPFSLKYIEIGNENWGPDYAKLYLQFYKAIKAKYPHLRTIACEAGPASYAKPEDGKVLDIVDEHYYVAPEWFMANSNRYDSYDRKGPKVFVGEYAVNQNVGDGNYYCALSEAAFMTGMERNSDVVELCSYAPIFKNLNKAAWNVDMILYDSKNSFGRSSYYVQKLFAENRPDYNTPYVLKTESQKVAKFEQGTVGLAAYKTAVQFKDVVVKDNNDQLIIDSKNGSFPKWNAISGTPEVNDGTFCFKNASDIGMAFFDTRNLENYTLECQAQILNGDEGFMIPFHVKDGKNFCRLNFGGWSNTQHAIEIWTNGAMEVFKTKAAKLNPNEWYNIKLQVNGAKVVAYLNDEKVFDCIIPERSVSTFFAASGIDEVKKELVVKLVNITPDYQSATLNLNGANVLPNAVATVLTGPSLQSENTVANPELIKPVTFNIANASNRFEYNVQPYSVTVLRFKLSGK